MVIQEFTVVLIELALSFKEDTVTDNNCTNNKLNEKGRWLNLNKVTTKGLQSIFKVALGKVSSQNHDTKLGIDGFDKEGILKFKCKYQNTKLRHVFFRGISGDIFSKEMMCRFGMVDNNTCKRCGRFEKSNTCYGIVEN